MQQVLICCVGHLRYAVDVQIRLYLPTQLSNAASAQRLRCLDTALLLMTRPYSSVVNEPGCKPGMFYVLLWGILWGMFHRVRSVAIE